jgi:hypothetical protein
LRSGCGAVQAGLDPAGGEALQGMGVKMGLEIAAVGFVIGVRIQEQAII